MKHDKLLREAIKRYDAAIEFDRPNREEALDDLEFLTGKQWPDDVKSSRENASRPILTINRMPQFLRQVTGDIRKINPAIRVSPADGDADKDVAEIFEGLVRHIEQQSDASSLFEETAESAAACGIGWFRVLTDYRDAGSFEQEIYLERIHNAFAVYCDPDARTPTREDARFVFVVERMDEDEFEAQYPGKRKAGWDASEPDHLRHWFDDDHVLVAEYWYKQPEKKTIGQLEDGRVIDLTENPGWAVLPMAAQREVEVDCVYWAKVTGADVLEGPVKWPGKHIPIIAVTGEEIHVGERIVRSGVIRYAKDPQRLYNYWRSAQAELIALQPKAPFVVTTKEIEGLERFWEAANNDNKAFLPYNPDPQAQGRPQRQTPPVPSAGMMQEVALAADDMKATTGVFDAALGNQSNETSGVAIRQRQMESDVSTSIYVDNLAKAIGHCGRILVDLIPKIYDTRRQVRILGEDGSEKIETVNDMVMTPFGPVPINDLSVGVYDVRVSTGPSYTTRRQEAAEGLIEFIRAAPDAAPVLLDIVARNMEWPGADEIADRLKKMLPPGIADDDPEEMTPEEQQARQAEAQAAQEQQQAAQEAQMAQLRKLVAEAMKAEASAQREAAQAEAAMRAIDRDDAMAEATIRENEADALNVRAKADLTAAQTAKTFWEMQRPQPETPRGEPQQRR
jgi:hypothetical protein